MDNNTVSVAPCVNESFWYGVVIFLIVINVIGVLCGLCCNFYHCCEEAIMKANDFSPSPRPKRRSSRNPIVK